jgi:hypothetical protein
MPSVTRYMHCERGLHVIIPIVDVVESSNLSTVNRISKQLLPTPESPTNRICKQGQHPSESSLQRYMRSAKVTGQCTLSMHTSTRLVDISAQLHVFSP